MNKFNTLAEFEEKVGMKFHWGRKAALDLKKGCIVCLTMRNEEPSAWKVTTNPVRTDLNDEPVVKKLGEIGTLAELNREEDEEVMGGGGLLWSF